MPSSLLLAFEPVARTPHGLDIPGMAGIQLNFFPDAVDVDGYGGVVAHGLPPPESRRQAGPHGPQHQVVYRPPRSRETLAMFAAFLRLFPLFAGLHRLGKGLNARCGQ